MSWIRLSLCHSGWSRLVGQCCEPAALCTHWCSAPGATGEIPMRIFSCHSPQRYFWGVSLALLLMAQLISSTSNQEGRVWSFGTDWWDFILYWKQNRRSWAPSFCLAVISEVIIIEAAEKFLFPHWIRYPSGDVNFGDLRSGGEDAVYCASSFTLSLLPAQFHLASWKSLCFSLRTGIA